MVLISADGFVHRPSSGVVALWHLTARQNAILDKFQRVSPIFLSNKDDDDNDSKIKVNLSNEDRLRQLGYRDDEIRRSQNTSSKKEDIKVRVDLVDDVDPVTLTAIGFALIALNFLVFANLGDGGISGIVATIINSF
jgi:hypothetical protein